MSRLSVKVEPELVEEARELAQVKTKREAIEVALREFVQRRHLADLAHLAGSDLVEMELEELEEWRGAGHRQR